MDVAAHKSERGTIKGTLILDEVTRCVDDTKGSLGPHPLSITAAARAGRKQVRESLFTLSDRTGKIKDFSQSENIGNQ